MGGAHFGRDDDREKGKREENGGGGGDAKRTPRRRFGGSSIPPGRRDNGDKIHGGRSLGKRDERKGDTGADGGGLAETETGVISNLFETKKGIDVSVDGPEKENCLRAESGKGIGGTRQREEPRAPEIERALARSRIRRFGSVHGMIFLS